MDRRASLYGVSLCSCISSLKRIRIGATNMDRSVYRTSILHLQLCHWWHSLSSPPPTGRTESIFGREDNPLVSAAFNAVISALGALGVTAVHVRMRADYDKFSLKRGDVAVLHPHDASEPCQWFRDDGSAALAEVMALGLVELTFCDPPTSHASVAGVVRSPPPPASGQRSLLSLVPDDEPQAEPRPEQHPTRAGRGQ